MVSCAVPRSRRGARYRAGRARHHPGATAASRGVRQHADGPDSGARASCCCNCCNCFYCCTCAPALSLRRSGGRFCTNALPLPRLADRILSAHLCRTACRSELDTLKEALSSQLEEKEVGSCRHHPCLERLSRWWRRWWEIDGSWELGAGRVAREQRGCWARLSE